MPDMIRLLIWHYLQAVVVVVALGFVGLIIQTGEEGDYWAAIGSAAAAAGLIYVAAIVM